MIDLSWSIRKCSLLCSSKQRLKQESVVLYVYSLQALNIMQQPALAEGFGSQPLGLHSSSHHSEPHQSLECWIRLRCLPVVRQQTGLITPLLLLKPHLLKLVWVPVMKIYIWCENQQIK